MKEGIEAEMINCVAERIKVEKAEQDGKRKSIKEEERVFETSKRGKRRYQR